MVWVHRCLVTRCESLEDTPPFGQRNQAKSGRWNTRAVIKGNMTKSEILHLRMVKFFTMGPQMLSKRLADTLRYLPDLQFVEKSLTKLCRLWRDLNKFRNIWGIVAISKMFTIFLLIILYIWWFIKHDDFLSLVVKYIIISFRLALTKFRKTINY